MRPDALGHSCVDLCRSRAGGHRGRPGGGADSTPGWVPTTLVQYNCGKGEKFETGVRKFFSVHDTCTITNVYGLQSERWRVVCGAKLRSSMRSASSVTRRVAAPFCTAWCSAASEPTSTRSFFARERPVYSRLR